MHISTDTSLPVLDVIVRTLADAARTHQLFRALDSIQGQAGVRARPIVVVNGQNFLPATLAALQQRAGVVVHQEATASAAVARAAGRRCVQAPFFMYLDDDDELVADSLLAPLQWLQAHADCDVLATAGAFVRPDGSLQKSTHVARHVARPDLGLLEECWLAPGATFFRSASVSTGMVDAPWSYLEWTWLAFELCARNCCIRFLDADTVRYHDTPGSMSKHLGYHRAELDLLRSVRRDMRLAADVRRAASGKYFRTLHNLSLQQWREGRHVQAWRYHLCSLTPPHTFQYLLFSRKLLWPFARRGG